MHFFGGDKTPWVINQLMRLARAPVYLFLLIIIAESISMSIFAAPINNGDEICVGRPKRNIFPLFAFPSSGPIFPAFSASFFVRFSFELYFKKQQESIDPDEQPTNTETAIRKH